MLITFLMTYSIPNNLIEVYIQRRKVDIEVLEKSISENSLEAFHRIGHQLSGNARSFGFPELESVGLRMEKLSSQALATEGLQLVAELSSWLSLQLAHKTEK